MGDLETIDVTCRSCGNPVPADRQRYRSKYCTNRCSRDYQKKLYREANGRVSTLPTGTAGAISELLVAADLLRRGYAVFRALSQSCSCDLAILKGSQLLRVEVRSGYRTVNGAVSSSIQSKDKGRYDLLAVVFRADGSIHYTPSLDS